MPLKLSTLLPFLLFLGHATGEDRLSLSANVTEVVVGEPFSVSCLVADYEPKEGEVLSVFFSRSTATYSETLQGYNVKGRSKVVARPPGQPANGPASIAVDSEEQRWAASTFKFTEQKDLKLSLQKARFPLCELTLVASTPTEWTYKCRFTSSSLPRYYHSNELWLPVRRHP